MSNLPLPGMAAISLWMLALALVGVAGVLTGHYPSGGARVGILILCLVTGLLNTTRDLIFPTVIGVLINQALMWTMIRSIRILQAQLQ